MEFADKTFKKAVKMSEFEVATDTYRRTMDQVFSCKGKCLVESDASCVVAGMPFFVGEVGLRLICVHVFIYCCRKLHLPS